jgi:hypothetical protein
MGAMASTDVTVTVNQQDRNCAGVDAPKNVVIATIAFGDGSLTYPTNGIPLPAIGNFGLHKGIDFMAIQGKLGAGYEYNYDATNHSIEIWNAGTELSGAVAATTLKLLIFGE